MSEPADKCSTCKEWNIVLTAPTAPPTDMNFPFNKALPIVVCPRCDKFREMVTR